MKWFRCAPRLIKPKITRRRTWAWNDNGEIVRVGANGWLVFFRDMPLVYCSSFRRAVKLAEELFRSQWSRSNQKGMIE